MMYESDPSNTKHLGRIAVAAVRLGALGPRLARLAEGLDHQAKEQAARAQSIAQNMAALTAHLDEATQELLRSSNDVEAALTTVARIAQHMRILAINASVEASRAGEHGRGFAVVVEEVQRLADKTGATTQQIEQRVHDMRASIARVASMTGATEGKQASLKPVEMSTSTVAAANEQVHGVAALASRQLATADELSLMGADVKAVTEGLLLAVGTFRFAAHARAEGEIVELIGQLSDTDLERVRVERIMERWIERHHHFELVYLTDHAGRQIVDNIACADRRARHEAGYKRDWSDRPWYRDAIAHSRICITDIYRSTATGDFCFTIAAALRHAGGELRGVLGADVNFQQLLAR